ncbi:aldo/keto reductase [Paenibacillus sp. MWE-103]|uniref:Aldo/keto reductase n=1 Tax=Paenibacillus artemisiicola TaxID=1172618 RepID=A0ABS3WF82_9BACL|nr:aldo/keto reductase [Paenibacillus artemisiicola]MBO7746976.1 aldo/keto reductase [Paenibacillus artemisiicola]
MQYGRLGGSGLEVSALGLGTNAFGKRCDREASAAIIDRALDAGVNFIDTANIYAGTASETIIGHALKGKRDRAVLATKAGLPRRDGPNGGGSSRQHLRRELEESLARLQTDYVDLYQIHTFDPYTPLEETLRALDDFVRAGKVRYVGASNYAAWELTKALGLSELKGLNRYASVQTSYSLADRTPERELVPACLDQGVGIIPYFPLAGGILSGKYAGDASAAAPQGSRADTDRGFTRFMRDRELSLGQAVKGIADAHGVRPGALSLAWLMARPAVSTVIVGATKAEQLTDNLAALSIGLTPELQAELDAVSEPFRGGEPFAVYRLP